MGLLFVFYNECIQITLDQFSVLTMQWRSRWLSSWFAANPLSVCAKKARGGNGTLWTAHLCFSSWLSDPPSCSCKGWPGNHNLSLVLINLKFCLCEFNYLLSCVSKSASTRAGDKRGYPVALTVWSFGPRWNRGPTPVCSQGHGMGIVSLPGPNVVGFFMFPQPVLIMRRSAVGSNKLVTGL